MTDKYDRAGRLKFLKIDDSTAKTLTTVRPVIEGGIDKVLEDFYAHVAGEPHVAQLFPSQQSMTSARSAQKTHWLNSVFSGNFDETYMSSITRIGQTHERVGLEPRWYLAGYCFALNELVRVVINHFRKRPDDAIRALQAINKGVFLDMDLAISIYIDTAKETAQKQLNGHADTFESEVKGIVEIVSAAATELQATSQTMNLTAERAREQSSAAGDAAHRASANVETVASAAEQLSASIAEISGQVTRSAAVAGEAVSEAERTNVLVQGLAEAAQKIGDVVKLISDIANQTNLLALNATIEAARAGEAGKGFAVVASEVKNLAKETAKATDEISAQIQGIQDATSGAVNAIQGIGATIGNINEIASTIAAAVEEQGAATREIARNVQEAAAGTTQVTDNINEVSQATEETGHSASEVLTAASELARQSEGLTVEVDRFLTDIRQSG